MTTKVPARRGRPPIGDRAMTRTEIQRRYRQKRRAAFAELTATQPFTSDGLIARIPTAEDWEKAMRQTEAALFGPRRRP